MNPVSGGPLAATRRRERLELSKLQGSLAILALTAWAITQPVLYTLGTNATLLVYHDLSPLQIHGLALIAVAVPPLFVLVTCLLAGLFSRRGFRAAVYLWLLALLAVYFDVLLNTLLAEQAAPFRLAIVVLPTSLSLATLGVLLYARFSWMRDLLALLSVSAVVFVLQFLFFSEATALVARSERPLTQAPPARDLPDIVMVVFDALPTASLINGELAIDGRSFPSFDDLSRTSTWYRNHSTVAMSTTEALPALLTGKLPRAGALATASRYPNNLLSSLSRLYDVRSHESITQLFTQRSHTQRRFSSTAFARDVAIVFGHQLVPYPWKQSLPRIDQSWGDFGVERSIAVAPNFYRWPIQGFLDGIATLSTNPKRAQLFFLHAVFPHRPYFSTGSLKRYHPGSELGLTPFSPGSDPIWSENQYYVAQAYQRHLLQTQAADSLLGALFQKLKLEGMWEKTVLVVTADHGVSFHPGKSKRNAENVVNQADILAVPLFIKAPGQTEGRVVDWETLAIDVVPTLFEVIGVELDWSVAGRSLASGEPDSKRIRTYQAVEKWRDGDRRNDGLLGTYTGDLLSDLRRAVEYKERLFDPERGFRIRGEWRTYGSLLGKTKRELVIRGSSSVDCRLRPEAIEAARAEPESYAVVQVVGTVDVDRAEKNAVLVGTLLDGELFDLTPLIEASSGTMTVSVMLPEMTYVELEERVEFLLYRGGHFESLDCSPRAR